MVITDQGVPCAKRVARQRLTVTSVELPLEAWRERVDSLCGTCVLVPVGQGSLAMTTTAGPTLNSDCSNFKLPVRVSLGLHRLLIELFYWSLPQTYFILLPLSQLSVIPRACRLCKTQGTRGFGLYGLPDELLALSCQLLIGPSVS
jgi:hypothetical protein